MTGQGSCGKFNMGWDQRDPKEKLKLNEDEKKGESGMEDGEGVEM